MPSCCYDVGYAYYSVFSVAYNHVAHSHLTVFLLAVLDDTNELLTRKLFVQRETMTRCAIDR